MVNYIFLFPTPVANYQDNWRCISAIKGDGSSLVPSPSPPSLSGPPLSTGASSSIMLSGTHLKDKSWYVYNINSLYCYIYMFIAG